MMIRKCCVCHRVKTEGQWRKEGPVASGRRVSHVYCPSCFTETMARINRYHLSFKSKNVPRSELENVVHGM